MDNLIFDRTQSDVALSKDLKTKVNNGTATDEEIALWNTDLKGSYNASDLNRVESWTNYLNDKFNEMGYKTTGYKTKPCIGEVEYIESTGTQYIDTGIVPNSKTRIKVDYQLTNNNSNGTSVGIVGAYEYIESTGMSNGMLLGLNSNNLQFAYGWGFNGKSKAVDTNRHTAIINDNGICTFDGETLATLEDVKGSLDVNKSIFLGWSNGGTTQKAIMRLYSCKIYQGEQLVRNFIPAIDSNGVVCLYDKVSKTYFYNKGTGGFIAGFTNGAKLAYEVRNFKDTSLFNLNQNSIRTLVNEPTPISNNLIRLSRNAQYEYPASGFTLSNKPELQFDGNVVACILYKCIADTSSPWTGWSKNSNGSDLWNCWADNDKWMSGNTQDKWVVKRVKLTREHYNSVRAAGCFGFSLYFRSYNIVLDIAGISFYNLTDEQYADDDFVNSLGVAGFGVPEIPFEWKYGDDFILEEADRIINNVRVLRDVIAMNSDTPTTPETMRFLDYIKANDIEKILFDINKLTENIIANYRYSNTFYSGEVGLD